MQHDMKMAGKRQTFVIGLYKINEANE